MENFNHTHPNSQAGLHLNPHYNLPLHLQQPTEIMSRNHPELRPRYPSTSQDHNNIDQSNQMLPPDPEDGMPGASDFVRKLFR